MSDMTDKEKREFLKKAGWKRRDRHTEERWMPQWDGVGLPPMYVSLDKAWRTEKGPQPGSRTPEERRNLLAEITRLMARFEEREKRRAQA